MSKETYQEIKRMSGEELRDLLSDLDNVFDFVTGTECAKVIWIQRINEFLFIAVVLLNLSVGFFFYIWKNQVFN